MARAQTKRTTDATPLWEWIVAAIGAVLIIGALAAVISRAISAGEPEVSFRIEVISTTKVSNGFAVSFRAHNDGTKTAAAVNIEGKLSRGGTEVETASASISYVPAESAREGGLFFTNDPAEHEVSIRATGYEKP